MSNKAEFQQKRTRDIEKRTVNDWRRVLNLVEGRRVVYSILLACSHRHNAFVPGDTHATAYNCAMRALGNWIEDFVRKADPTSYEQMKQEYEAEIKQLQKDVENVEDD
jgi:hypothetical protein